MYKKLFLSWVFLLTLFPAQAFAHSDSNSKAPDMHPLFVMLEFIFLIIIGYGVAKGLSRIGEKKSQNNH